MNIKYWFFLSLFIVTIVQADELANKEFRAALAVCEKALQVETPKSSGSLSRLSSLLKRYQRSRDSALAIDPSLKDSTEQHYKGDYFADKSFVEVYRICENELANKVSQAELQVKQREANRKARQQQILEQSDELIKNMSTAKEYVTAAINQHCISYLRTPTLKEEALSSLYQEYQQARQKALETYPDIVKQFHRATMIDPDSGEEQVVSKTIENWFKYCDAQFTHQDSVSSVKEEATVPSETEGPLLPPSSTEVKTPTTVPQPEKNEAAVSDEAEIDPEYQEALKNFKGGRLKVLTDEKRLPDFVNDEDNNLQKASVWQYEDDKKCTTYTFQGDNLIKPKITPGECDSF
jgi:arginyl-tRNA--protein-N-Asp/Glu arginylyltransferase